MTPFKVVCIDNKSYFGATEGARLLKVDSIYTVIEQRICEHGSKQGELMYDLAEVNPEVYQFLASRFVPLQPSYSNISKEIAESVKEVSECPDKIIIKEPVNN